MNNTRKRKTRKEYEFMKDQIPKLLDEGWTMTEIAKEYNWGLSPMIVFAKKHCNYKPIRYEYDKEEIKAKWKEYNENTEHPLFKEFHLEYYPELGYNNLFKIIHYR